MKASKKIIEFITTFEGFKSKPYLDIAGVPTIGFGATYYQDGRKVTLNDNAISLACALDLKTYHVEATEKVVNKLVIATLNQNQFDALVSFTYNLGGQALKTSTLLKKINKNPNNPEIIKEFKKWIHVRDFLTKELVVSKGLLRRRTAEAQIYFS